MDKMPKIEDNSPEKEQEILAQIQGDPETWEAPQDTIVLRRGRPSGQSKSQVTIRLDNDILKALQATSAKGWQTRIGTRTYGS